MGIVILCLAMVLAIGAMISIVKDQIGFVFFGIVLFSITVACLTTIPSVSSDYPLVTSATIGGDDYRTAIYFKEFTQNGNEVVIYEYAVKALHWSDFNHEDVITTPLTITLLDNRGKFIYTDRRTGETFNEALGGTQ